MSFALNHQCWESTLCSDNVKSVAIDPTMITTSAPHGMLSRLHRYLGTSLFMLHCGLPNRTLCLCKLLLTKMIEVEMLGKVSGILIDKQ